MNKTENLQIKAGALKSLLERYAGTDNNAAMVLGFMMPTFHEIENGKLIPPAENKFRWYFGSTESPLYKYDDL